MNFGTKVGDECKIFQKTPKIIKNLAKSIYVITIKPIYPNRKLDLSFKGKLTFIHYFD